MKLPIGVDMEPMLASVQPVWPEGAGWVYEPKWDGFRTLAFRDGSEVELISRGARPMTRYFPELVEPLTRIGSERFVLDGEMVIVGAEGLDFDSLQLRLHPAASRVRLLSESTPAQYVAFDLLAVGDEDLRGLALSERRQRLEEVLAAVAPPVHITPYTTNPATGREWFEAFEGAGLDGIIAKRADQKYLAGKRGWVKIKHERTADCVVIGFRWTADKTSLGSLLLGLYDGEGSLHYVGHTSSFSAAERRALLERLEPLRGGEPAIPRGRMPGGQSRWSRGKEAEWEQLRPELVCEVSYDKLQSGQRFRHATGFKRWRPDKRPAECRFDQIESAAAFDVASIFGSR